ncbi:hypothetical protein pEaSNUABM29_00069 [Erwinia phage pEa_SNUABM_29]|nr:hypothetical protein pEaSNUABM29_00069 [Erwinia phage pEa_SNUABM_29]
MRLEFRQRSILLPLSGLLGAVSNLSTVRFTDDDRRVLVLAAMEELLWSEFYVSPLSGTLQAPFVEGKLSKSLVAMITAKRQNPITLRDEIAGMRSKLFEVIEELLLKTGLMVSALRVNVPWEPGHPPRIFDHGYKLAVVMPRGKRNVSLGRWLQISWVRPTVEWQEMGVSSYVNTLLEANRKTSPETRERIQAMPLSTLLDPDLTWAAALELLNGVK